MNECGGLYNPCDKIKVNAIYSIPGTSLTLHPQGEDPVTLQCTR